MSCSSLRRSGLERVNEGSHSFTCHPQVYPQVEWAIGLPAFSPSRRASPHFGCYSFPVPLRVGGWVGNSRPKRQQYTLAVCAERGSRLFIRDPECNVISGSGSNRIAMTLNRPRTEVVISRVRTQCQKLKLDGRFACCKTSRTWRFARVALSETAVDVVDWCWVQWWDELDENLIN